MSIELQGFSFPFDIFFVLTRDAWDLIIETVTSSELIIEFLNVQCWKLSIPHPLFTKSREQG